MIHTVIIFTTFLGNIFASLACRVRTSLLCLNVCVDIVIMFWRYVNMSIAILKKCVNYRMVWFRVQFGEKTSPALKTLKNSRVHVIKIAGQNITF